MLSSNFRVTDVRLTWEGQEKRASPRGKKLYLTPCSRTDYVKLPRATGSCPGGAYELSDRTRVLIPHCGDRGEVFEVTVSKTRITVHLDRVIARHQPKPRKQKGQKSVTGKTSVSKLRTYKSGDDQKGKTSVSKLRHDRDPAGITNKTYFQFLRKRYPLPSGYLVDYDRESPADQAKRLNRKLVDETTFLTPIHKVRALRYGVRFMGDRIMPDGATRTKPFRTYREAWYFAYRHGRSDLPPANSIPPAESKFPPFDLEYRKKPAVDATPSAPPVNGQEVSLERYKLDLENRPKLIRDEIATAQKKLDERQRECSVLEAEIAWLKALEARVCSTSRSRNS